jgi:hypothetical protein
MKITMFDGQYNGVCYGDNKHIRLRELHKLIQSVLNTRKAKFMVFGGWSVTRGYVCQNRGTHTLKHRFQWR